LILNYGQLADRVAASYIEAPKLVLKAPIVRAGDDIRLVLDQRQDELLVVVPGTTDFAGWMDDFATFPRYFAEVGWYHDGFGSHGIPLFTQLMEHLPAPGHGMLTTYVGHSLGGALARVLAIQHHRSFFGAYRLVTFGEPRGAAFWNYRAKSYLNTARDIKRFARAGDPIPHVPFAPLYKHLSRWTMIGTRVDSLDPMDNHNIALYASDLKALGI
jgi:pimeloyl-ACP methyl ester carboxylesterase